MRQAKILKAMGKGLVVILALGGTCGGVYYSYTVNFPAKPITEERLTPEERENLETYVEQEARIAEEQIAKSELLELEEEYTHVSLVANVIHYLYDHKNFKMVSEQLVQYRDEGKTPYERYRYSRAVDFLSKSWERRNERVMIETLGEWVALEPDNYYPRLFRANVAVSLADKIRDGRYWNEGTEEEWKQIKTLYGEAWDDLTVAFGLYPKDPELTAALAYTAVGAGAGPEVMREFHDKTLALNPYHLGVRLTMIHFLQPQWFGTEMMDLNAYVDESEVALAESPYLFELFLTHADFWKKRNKWARGRQWDAPESLRANAEACRLQLEQSPDEATVLARGAFFTGKLEDFSTAATYFLRLGNRFPSINEFSNLCQFHEARMNAFIEASDDPGVRGTPQEKVLLDAALASEPTNGPLSRIYLDYLLRTRDDVQTRAFFETVQDPFIKTGSWGDPVDYDYVEALALANGLFWDGIRGEKTERGILDRAMELAPDNAFVHLIYGEYHVTRDENRKARKYLERAQELDPAYLPAKHTLAWLCYHEKRWDEGIALARELLSSDPSFYIRANTDDIQEIVDLCTKKKSA